MLKSHARDYWKDYDTRHRISCWHEPLALYALVALLVLVVRGVVFIPLLVLRCCTWGTMSDRVDALKEWLYG
jgi:hypothetical protein